MKALENLKRTGPALKSLSGLTARLVAAIVVLTVGVQWFNYDQSSNLRDSALQQREVDNINAISQIVGPRLDQEIEHTGIVARLLALDSDLSSSMRLEQKARRLKLMQLLDNALTLSRVDILEVTDEAGAVLFRAQAPSRHGDRSSAWGVDEALQGSPVSVSTKDAQGASILSIEPIWSGNRVVGTIIAGRRIDNKYIDMLSKEVGARLALVGPSGDVVVAGQEHHLAPDIEAVKSAFSQKIPVYRTNSERHATQVYLPMLIVDEAWIVMTEIDSTAAYQLRQSSNRKSALSTLAAVVGSTLAITMVVWLGFRPLRRLQRRAREILSELGSQTTVTVGHDDIDSVVKTIDALTQTLVQRNRDLALERANIQASANRYQVQATATINRLAFYDPLTDQPNRRFLLVMLEKALAEGLKHPQHGALLIIDLDHFMLVNDTLGHDKGDLLLRLASQRISAVARDNDIVARLSGDEFALVLKNLSDDRTQAIRQVESMAKVLLTELAQPYSLGAQEHAGTVSIGVALFSQYQGSLDGLLRQADLAMYQAKSAGRNTYRFFDPEMQSRAMTRSALERDLRDALPNDQFVLHYQAQVSGHYRITGAEILLRWQHPLRGLVAPNAFIGLAEETGLILAIGHWVLKMACQQLVAWAEHPVLGQLTLSVNVSARQFHQVDFVDQVQALIQHTGANPRRLKLELTESMLVDDMHTVVTKMAALKSNGIAFSLDDFGTGYSALSYLKRLPLDQLKIDQGFVRDILVDPNDASIAKMIIVLADSLGLEVIAEGVETTEQRDYLEAQGCHAFQGYLFGRPVPVQDFEHMVKPQSTPVPA